MLVIHPNVAEEIIQVQQVRQAVALRGLYDIPLLAEFNTPVDTDLYDFSRGVGLGNKVDRADLQAIDLRALIRRHNDHRNGPELLLFLHHLQDLHAAHLRHLKVKQHDGQIVFMGFDLFQRFISVRGIQNLIVLLQHIAQNHLIDVLVLYNENMPFEIQYLGVFIRREYRLCGNLCILPRNRAHALQKLLFFIHQPVCPFKHIMEAGVRSGLII